jgi:hypothetical protein
MDRSGHTQIDRATAGRAVPDMAHCGTRCTSLSGEHPSMTPLSDGRHVGVAATASRAASRRRTCDVHQTRELCEETDETNLKRR